MDRLYVECFWPHERVEFDITDPDSLREVGYLPLSQSDRQVAADGVAYGLVGHSDVEVRAWTIADGALIEGDPLVVPKEPDRDPWSFNALSVLYATKRGALLAYRLRLREAVGTTEFFWTQCSVRRRCSAIFEGGQ